MDELSQQAQAVVDQWLRGNLSVGEIDELEECERTVIIEALDYIQGNEGEY